VTIAIGDDHVALHDAVRRFTGERCPPEVVRAAADAEGGAAGLPPFWEEVAKLGWLGLAVPDAAGGEGYGCSELVVVLEELGRALAPGPMLPTAWAATALGAAAAAGADLGGWPGDLATGRRAGTVACGSPLAADAVGDRVGEGEGNGLVVSGATEPLLCGGTVDVVLVPVVVSGHRAVALVECGHAGVTALDSLDPTRPLARLRFDAAPAVLVPGLDAGRVEALGVVLAAAEAAGGAAWCVDIAAAYAATRRQFGRPIGQFQAVKHRCADMLVALEQARALAWDAARALDGDPGAPGATLAAAAAGAVALDAFAATAKGCIQVLGGIGFTWEHDAHRYLRRAMALRQLLGGGARWREAAARAALDGARRPLALHLPAAVEAVRGEVRAFAAEAAALPADEQRRRLAECGYLVPHWAPPWGRDAGAVEQIVIEDELRRAGIRVPHLQVGAWAAPTIAVHGTPEQQERWVRPTLLGDITWCQLFSEPEAGSDLAGLTSRATRTGGGWLLDGHKVWTTMAAEADWGICLARTDPALPKHVGITYFVVDMRSSGIDVRPLRELTGLAMFNEVFLNGVFVPDDCVIGEVGGGWPLARTTLANERVSMGRGSSFGGGVEALVRLVAERVESGALVLDARLLDELGALAAEAHAVAVIGLRQTARSMAGAAPGPEASVRKLLAAEHDQRTQELGLTLLGPEGATTEGAAGQWTFGFLANRCLTIAGGTSEIQRNVIGERLLGLPRDPEPTAQPER
jgi:alkylation response protein AidB-like acyl-CoA dehydrogenase